MTTVTASEYVLALTNAGGKAKIVKVSALADGQREATSELLMSMGGKEIDGLTADVLGVESVSKAKDKPSAIKRLLKTAAEKLPAPAEPIDPGKKRAKKAKEPKAPRSFTAAYDPADEAAKKRFADLAPQGRACVLSILGLRHEPKEAKEAAILAADLAGRLEEFKALFGESKAKLRRTFAYYAQTLENEGFLTRVGGRHKRATDGYLYQFRRLSTQREDEAEIPAWDGLSPIAKAVANIAMGEDGVEAELTGAKLKGKLLKAKLSGRLATRRDAFLAFQRVEAELVKAGVLRVATDEEEN